MSLSDVMSHLRLDLYAELAIVLFFAAFAAIAANALLRRREDTQRHASLPLSDDEPGITADLDATARGTNP